MGFDTFTRKYKLAKTLRFELRPVGRTLETFKEKFLPGDERRDAAYPVVKEMLDGEHKALLERALSHSELDWAELAQAHEVYRTSDKTKEAKDALADRQAEFRKKLVELFKADEAFRNLTAPTPKDAFATLKKRLEDAGDEIPDELKMFLRFSCFFKGYQENRRNIYSDEAQATAAANRAVNENFPKFLEGVRIFSHLRENYPSIVADAEKELAPVLDGRSTASIFSPSAYGEFLPQSGIDFFNQVLGGFVPAEGEKVRGLNEFINLYRQRHEEARADRALSPLRPLYKQILSDRETLSLIPRALESDADAIDALRAMFETRLLKFETESGPVNVLDAMRSLLNGLSLSDAIWVDGSEISRVSKDLLGSWVALGTLMESSAEARFASESTEKKRVAAVEKWMGKSVFPLSELSDLRQETDTGTTIVDVSKLWKGPVAAQRFDAARAAIANLLPLLSAAPAPSTPLRERREDVAKIKAALDAVLDILHFVKPLHAGADLDRDESFYGVFDALYAALDGFVPLYNKIRNYLTRKPGETESIKLMFENPTLADGWDQNKEKDNTCVLLLRDGPYYLGVMNPDEKTDFSKLAGPESPGCYRKMVYKQIGQAANYFSIKQIKPQNPPQFVLNWMSKGFDKKTLSRQQLSKLISYVIEDFIPHYPKLHDKNGNPFYDFAFKPAGEYASWKEFTDHIDSMGLYRISFENVPAEAIDRLVDEGRLCLFLLWNKDFSQASTGRPNLHTQYWKAAFAPENLRDVVVKLNGEAELFFRPKSIREPFRHKVGEKMVNRRGADGTPVPESVHGELFRHFNGSTKPLSPEAERWLSSGNLVVKDVSHEIVKDRRFAEDHFSFHVPLTINFKQPDAPAKFNDQVRDFLRANPDVNVIGIDRGERNLIYLALVDGKGNLLEQRSFNAVSRTRRDGVEVSTDYHAKLAQAEKDRAEARASWAEIGAIKDLKEGYLSAVVHEIAKMMVERNAIVVLEDLNFGFKRGRFRIERQVYQKFEKALIDKLNYLVFKDRGMAEPGGTLCGYQFTDKFTSFERIGRQTGFLFYVPAGYTSKIDPTTGFTNLFNTKKCTNAAGVRDFFSAFDSIRWDATRHAFAFAFDYRNFKTSQESHRANWTVYSASRRLVFDKVAGAEKEIDPTKILLDAVKGRGVSVVDGFDLKALLLDTEPSKANAGLFRDVFYAFDRTLQMRNSSSRTGEDYIESPVLNGRGEFFDSRKADDSLPKDADANGAYHIALKGVQLLEENIAQGNPDLKIDHKAWFRFAQELAKRKFCQSRDGADVAEHLRKSEE